MFKPWMFLYLKVYFKNYIFTSSALHNLITGSFYNNLESKSLR